ncbi:uncharacterized protein LOC132744465 [Ruditapes philippinarum]|uniref:uncharacterized protein LOC132744465 n=1 Tax=Ruditapes philippinarum TaxID=129788 RepID=UPI00295AE8A3|nr:uncharacterized protein LOC132744465 [Ruditapes philippinarum]
MRILVQVLVLIVVHVKCISSHPGEFSKRSDDCRSYFYYATHDMSCRDNDMFMIRNDFISDVRATCSSMAHKDTYLDCMKSISTQCPQQYAEVANSIRNKLNMFCEGNDVSQWLQLVVPDWVSINRTCSKGPLDELYTSCIKEFYAQNELGDSITSYETASAVLPRMMSDVFNCMKTNLELTPALLSGCGSSWQHILLEFWLKTLYFASIFQEPTNGDKQEFLNLALSSAAQSLK